MSFWPDKVLRGCKGKIPYKSIGLAEASARALERLDEREGRKAGQVNAYFCVRCRKFHVGHRKAA